ncbi:hypothetical protein HP062_09770 [Pseudomonas sp. B14-6]|nr:hypothetical protein HP062_09770 [Pseudomonas sp. B14-6]TWS08793.1 hypothetical protein FJD35_19485 [Pseudomonas mandelii]
MVNADVCPAGTRHLAKVVTGPLTFAQPGEHGTGLAFTQWLYEQQKFPTEYIQALLGHADEKMTKHYQEGHDEKKIEYLEVSAELAF